MDLIELDDDGRLFLSPAIDDWLPITDRQITVVFDLEGDLDHGVSTRPGNMLYVYFPMFDEGLPDLGKLDALARMAAGLVRDGKRVLAHCSMGYNRSALLAGLTLVHLGWSGREAVQRVRERRPGALFNETFAEYLSGLPPHGTVT
jgi:protein-tyrosine phosphatase